jgi:hypothetical protein
LDEKVEENKLLLENKERTDALLMAYSENLTPLNGRVAALEVQQSWSSNMTVGTRGCPLQYITRFASKLFPELNKMQQLTSITCCIPTRNHSVPMQRPKYKKISFQRRGCHHTVIFRSNLLIGHFLKYKTAQISL